MLIVVQATTFLVQTFLARSLSIVFLVSFLVEFDVVGGIVLCSLCPSPGRFASFLVVRARMIVASRRGTLDEQSPVVCGRTVCRMYYSSLAQWCRNFVLRTR